MYKVYGIKNEMVWDAENNKPLIKFTEGVAETDNEKVANRLKNLGYKVEGELSDKKEVPLSEMSIKELKEYATEKGIEIGNATKKIDIITLIQNVGNH